MIGFFSRVLLVLRALFLPLPFMVIVPLQLSVSIMKDHGQTGKEVMSSLPAAGKAA